MTAISDDALKTLCDLLTLEEKVQLLTGKDSWTTHPLPRIGLRSMVLSDGPAGVRGDTWDERSPSLNLPSPTAAAASWDRELMHRYGQALGSEAVRKNVDVVLGPTINLQRTPYGGRHFEAFSEDPFLTSELATEYVTGVQSFGVGATVKHYVANDSETDRFTVDVRVDERTLRELYLLAFERPIIDGHAWLVMSSYNSVNGVTASENDLLDTPLNSDWGFDGVVVSDWTAVRSIESARKPQDLAMPGPSSPWSEGLVDAVRGGTVEEVAIDRKVIRLLRLAARVGALAGINTGGKPAPLPSADLQEFAVEASVAGSVLLKNEGLLPLSSPRTIAVVGEGAVFARTQGGGSATVIPASVITPLEGIAKAFPDADISWSHGAVVQRGLADLADGSFTGPDGEPGMLVRYYSESVLLADEHRLASGIVSFDGNALAARSDLIEMHLVYTTADNGQVSMGIAGLCDYEVIADGVLIAGGELRLRPDDDPAAAVLHPPIALFDVPLAGAAVKLRIRFVPKLGEMGEAMSFRIGTQPTKRSAKELIADAVEATRAADVAIVVVSTSAEVESEGFDRASLTLPGAQDDLVRAVAAVNPNTIVIVNTGAPTLLPWSSVVASIVAMWFPGQGFGEALGRILTGAAEPRGRLPMTWPADEEAIPVSTVTPDHGILLYDEGVHVGHRAWLRAGVTPAFPFGFGLGYTTWAIASAELPAVLSSTGGTVAAVTVTNTGSRAGNTVVQLYVERESPSQVDRPVRWLAGFASVSAAPGETIVVGVPIATRSFEHWDEGWQCEPGVFRVIFALSSVDARLERTLTVDIQLRPSDGYESRRDEFVRS